jgi:hypothetical protein
MSELGNGAHPSAEGNGMANAEAVSQPERRAGVYAGPLVMGAFALSSGVAGGVSEALGAESAANAGFAFAAICVISALGGAVLAHRKSRREHD